MSRMRRTLPPRKSLRPAARIASERARSARSGARERPPARTPARARGTPRAGGAASRSRGEAKAPSDWLRAHRRLAGWMLAMAALGFLTVRAVDLVQRVTESGQLSAWSAADLWQKLVDRMLDRDVPRTGVGGAAAPGGGAGAPRTGTASAPRARSRPQSPAVPPASSGGAARAELPVTSPERYARESRTLGESRGASAATPRSRERIDAILRKVGAEPTR